MPVVDGIKAVQEIRRQSNVPVIMLTAKSDTFDKVLALGDRRRRLCGEAV